MDTEGSRIEIIMSHIRPFIITGTDPKTNRPYYNLIWERIANWFDEETQKLQTQIEQLEAKEKQAREVAFEWQVTAQKRREQTEQLEKENKGLEEALKKIIVDCWIPRIKEIAIQALQKGEAEE